MTCWQEILKDDIESNDLHLNISTANILPK